MGTRTSMRPGGELGVRRRRRRPSSWSLLHRPRPAFQLIISQSLSHRHLTLPLSLHAFVSLLLSRSHSHRRHSIRSPSAHFNSLDPPTPIFFAPTPSIFSLESSPDIDFHVFMLSIPPVCLLSVFLLLNSNTLVSVSLSSPFFIPSRKLYLVS